MARRLVVSLMLSTAVLLASASASAGDPASDLAEAEAARSAASAEMAAASAAVKRAEGSLAPVAARADKAERAVATAEAEADSIEAELADERQAAAEEIEVAEASYADKQSSHDLTTGLGIGLAVVAALLALAGLAFARFRSWPLSRNVTGLLAGAVGLLFVGGLALAFVPSSPDAPEFSEETEELAAAAAGDPADPATAELREARARVARLEEKAEPFDAARDRSEERLEAAETEAQRAERTLAAAKRDESAAEATVNRIEARVAAEARFREEATTIDYGQLIKNPNAYKGAKVVYTGQVLQIQEEGGFGFMLLSVTDEGYGFWTDNIWVDFEQRTSAAEEDVITVYGKLTGSEEYETQIGGSTYVPKMRAKYIDD